MNFSNNEDIVISGIDGRFPKSRNMEELGRNLYNKVRILKYLDRKREKLNKSA